jgi:ribosomal protein S18 acetylase RimI-like enzyme
LLIRIARESEDWQACLDMDLSYETDSAWQTVALPDGNVWGMSFREIRLPRKQHVEHPLAMSSPLKSWKSRDKFWVAVEKREIVGFIGVRLELEHHQIRITELAVTPQFRRKGIATELLRRAAEWCADQPVDQIILECPSKAHPAISFALKHHFVFCGFQDNYWPGQEVGLFFRQRLRH